MEKDLTPYEQSLTLKEELGFNEPCFVTFDDNKDFEIQDFEQTYDTFPSHMIASPLKSQVFRWFRKKHGLFIRPDFDVNYIDELDEFETTYFFSILEMEESLVGFKPLGRLSSEKTYEEAELECLKKLIEIVKNK
jgi:hypothetical protein